MKINGQEVPVQVGQVFEIRKGSNTGHPLEHAFRVTVMDHAVEQGVGAWHVSVLGRSSFYVEDLVALGYWKPISGPGIDEAMRPLLVSTRVPVQVGQVYEIRRYGMPLPEPYRRCTITSRSTLPGSKEWATDISAPSTHDVDWLVARGQWVLVDGPGFEGPTSRSSDACGYTAKGPNLDALAAVIGVPRYPATELSPAEIVAACDANRSAFVATTSGPEQLPGRRPWGAR